MLTKKSKTVVTGSCKSALTCGSCSGLTRDKLIAGNKTPCIGVGKLASSKTCSSYHADVFALATLNDARSEASDTLQQIASNISDFTVSELTVFAALLLAERKTRKYKYRFWQKVYIRIRGTSSDNYLNNFIVGRVLDADKDYIRVVSETGKSCLQLVNSPDSVTVYTVAKFKPIRAEMRALKKIVDPATSRNLKKSASNHIETIDFAVSSGLVDDDFSVRQKNVRKSQRQDLVSIVGKMASGKILSRKDTEYNYDSGEISIHHR